MNHPYLDMIHWFIALLVDYITLLLLVWYNLTLLLLKMI
jgi:hypothetical protein